MKGRNGYIIFLLVFGILCAIGAAICGIVATTMSDSDIQILLYVVTGGLAFLAVFMIIFVFVGKSRNKAYLANVNNPNTIAHKVMGEGTKFDRFVVAPYNPGDFGRKAAINAAGILSAAVLGVGVMSYGKTYLDAFVSEEELIINSQNNPTYEDRGFMHYPNQFIENVEFVSKATCERVIITRVGTGEKMYLDVTKSSKTPAEKIRKSFSRLMTPLNKEEASKPAPDVFTEFKEEAQTATQTDTE